MLNRIVNIKMPTNAYGLCALMKLGFGFVVFIALLSSGCYQSSVTSNRGSESHFLMKCNDECSGDFQCISNICTLKCSAEGKECKRLSEAASCTSAGIEDDAMTVCDVSCDSNAECRHIHPELSCEQGFCRRPMASGNAQCEEGGQIYRSGATGIDAPMGCGTCTCNNGLLSCLESDCPIEGAVVPCETGGDSITEPIQIDHSLIVDDTLTLTVTHRGGCADHDYTLCYHELDPYYDSDEPSYKPDPRYLDTILIHHANADACETLFTRTLTFDLAPIGDMMNSFDLYNDGVVQIPFGFLAYSELSCRQRSMSMEWIASDPRKNPRACSSDSDCKTSAIETSCYSGCTQAVIGSSHQDKFDDIINQIETDICENFETDGCDSSSDDECDPPPPVACIDGKCTVEKPEVCSLTFDPGSCDEDETVFTFDPVLQACMPASYHGCEGNDNRFETHEACESMCNPAKLLPDCPPGRVPIRDCVMGSPTAGCGQYAWLCAKSCSEEEDDDPCADEPFLGWSSSPFSCVAGRCIIAEWSPM